MYDLVKPLADWCAAVIEAVGIVVIAAFAAYALLSAAFQKIRGTEGDLNFRTTRWHLGRGILLGLEFLIAADIIHTVAVDLTFSTVGVLAAIVLIRTFLSFTLDVELTGRWPWQKSG